MKKQSSARALKRHRREIQDDNVTLFFKRINKRLRALWQKVVEMHHSRKLT